MPEITVASACVRAILLDIEGTTTPIEFVHKTLFSFARSRIQDFLQQHWAEPDVRADVDRLRRQFLSGQEQHPSLPAWREDSAEALRASVLSYINWLMDRDSKSTPLKSLQGKLWSQGYAAGELKSQIYPDVAPALARWSARKKTISIFSSGSVQAQRLLFAHTIQGDLTPFLSAYFDTTTGPKREAESYGRIAASLMLKPADVLFISDTVEELDAARQAGMETAQSVRENHGGRTGHRVIHSFDQVVE